jgi:dipeptidase D
MIVQQLEPQALWQHFADLNAVPRPSKKEEKVRQFMVDFGQKLGLETIVDKIGNVIIKKPGSAGKENATTVILQSHLDMVHQKNADKIFDFDEQGIEMLVDGDWVFANGTTLGADNGIGVAAIMAVLSSKTLAHPPIEAFFTIDEETGMTGAKEMDGSLFQGKILLNLDTEDDDELSIGCAGGIDTNTYYQYSTEALQENPLQLTIQLRGLLGGHSGMDIDKGRGNANKWMARLLFQLSQSLNVQLLCFDGGSLRNAIPREAEATIVISAVNKATFDQICQTYFEELKDEYATIEPHHNWTIQETNIDAQAVSKADFTKILACLNAVHNGVFRMSPDIEGLVEASSSLARVQIQYGSFTTQSLQRSSVESTKAEVSMVVGSAFELAGCKVEQSGDYPGWKPNPNSDILRIMTAMYREKFHDEPKVKACHAGLECGILGKHLPGVDMISFGPNIRAAHSPDEKVQVSSVQKFWGFYLNVLSAIN